MKILFICTHNRCRSILAEAIANQFGGGVITAVSAGSQPEGHVHPLSLKYLQASGVSTDNLHSKSWDVFESDQIDVVVTVCDSAAAEACPLWLGDSYKVHWGLPDPSRLDGTDDDIEQAFLTIINVLKNRIKKLRTAIAENKPMSECMLLLEQLGEELVSFT